jgi:hypothetical protein
MSVVDPSKWADAVQRGRLTAQQEAELHAYLAKHPEEQVRWEEEFALNQLLGTLSDAPVATNFTARVLSAVGRNEPDRTPAGLLGRHWLAGWIPKLAGALSICCAGLLVYQHHQNVDRRQLAQSVVEFSKLTSGGAIEVLQNFDAIARLDQSPREAERQLAGDRELIAALQ